MKKINSYIILSLIICLFLSIIYAWKGIFPFGSNSVIWADMHNQITTFYYHLYDAIKGNSSIFIDFTTSGGINFFGIMAYYIVSPFSLIILFFKRADIYKIVSIITGLKFLLSGITCLYFIRKFFSKLPPYISVFLSIMYAFSGYNLIMYQITPWIDIVYLFPLLLIGLKDLIDLKSPVLYIVILTISLICCFYLTLLVLIFIVINTLIYIHYLKKEDKRKIVTSLGISTILSLMMGMFIFLPTALSIFVSSRIGLDFSKIFTSNVGPVGDKLSFIFEMGSLLILLVFGYIKLYKNKKHILFLKYIFITILLLALPIIIEPINRMLHMGSYVCFPYRYGFITIFYIIIGVAYCYNNIQNYDIIIKPKLWITLTATAICLINITVTVFNLTTFQTNIEKLVISRDLITYGLLSVMCLLTMLITLVFCLKYFKNQKLLFVNVIIINIVTLLLNMTIYLGMDFKMDELMNNYEKMTSLSETRKKSDIYRLKNLYAPLVRNFGMVSGYHTLDHFTSFTKKSNMDVGKRLGYSSLWMDTSSEGGTIFTDILLANKYLLSLEKYKSKYYDYKEEAENLNLYEMNLPISYGYMVNHNAEIMSSLNGFEANNRIYQTIVNKQEDLFDIDSDFAYENIKLIIKDNKIQYRIIDSNMKAFITQSIKVDDESILYLDILKSIYNEQNMDIRYKMKIYVNNKVLKEEYTTKNQNGILNLGTFENEKVDIKIELLNNIELTTLEIGKVETKKIEDFAYNYKLDTDVVFNKNKVNIKLTSDKSGILFLPLVYDKGFEAINNKNKTEVINLFDNYIGIYIREGYNDIKLTFTPPGLETGIYISIVGLIISTLLIIFKLYNKILNIKLLNMLFYNIYSLIFIGVIVGLYIIPLFSFIYTLLGGKL